MEYEWVKYLLAILSGLVTAIPLVLKLIEYVQKSVKEKNWPDMLDKLMQLMETAEEKFTQGAEKKEWVLAMMKASADSLNYDLDIEQVGTMIDSLCDMSNKVNAPDCSK
jgi:hypothetical protein